MLFIWNKNTTVSELCVIINRLHVSKHIPAAAAAAVVFVVVIVVVVVIIIGVVVVAVLLF